MSYFLPQEPSIGDKIVVGVKIAKDATFLVRVTVEEEIEDTSYAMFGNIKPYRCYVVGVDSRFHQLVNSEHLIIYTHKKDGGVHVDI